MITGDERGIAAATTPEPTSGLVFYDLKTCLRSLAAEPEKPAKPPKPRQARKKSEPTKKPATRKKPTTRKKPEPPDA